MKTIISALLIYALSQTSSVGFHANYTHQDLTGTDFSNSDLRHDSFNNATLLNANFTNSLINGADFTQVTRKGFSANQLYSTASYQRRDLATVNLEFNILSSWDFSSQNLKGASLVGSDLSGTFFNNALIAGVDFGNSTNLTPYQIAQTASYKNGNLSGVTIIGLNLDSINLSGKSLKNMNPNGYYAHTRQQTDIRNADLSYADLSGSKLYHTQFDHSDLTEVNMSHVACYSSSFSNANLQAADLSGSSFYDCNFSRANLRNASLVGVEASNGFDDADLTNADIRYMSIGEHNANNSSELFFLSSVNSNQIYSTASYKQKNLTGLSLINQSLDHWEFSGQNLRESNFSQSEMDETDFSNADLSYASFGTFDVMDSYGANVYHANLSNTTIKGATFVFAGDVFMDCGGLSSNQLYSTASYQEKDLSELALPAGNLEGWDFYGQNMTDANLSYCTLNNADFTDATIEGIDLTECYQFTSNQLYSTASYKNKKLGAIKLLRNNLATWDFSGQDLRGSSFYNSHLGNTVFNDARIQYSNFSASMNFTTNQLISTASFQQKDLSGIHFGFLDLAGMNLSNFDLSDTDFGGTEFNDVDLTEANIAGSKMSSSITSNQLYQTASYQQKDLHGVNFRLANLSRWDLSNQNLSYANLKATGLQSADLTGANLHMASLSDQMPSFDVVSGSTVVISNSSGTVVHGNIQNHEGGELQVHPLYSRYEASSYYQESGASLTFHNGAYSFHVGAQENLIFSPLYVKNTAELEEGAIIGCVVKARELVGYGTYNFLLLDAETLIVDGVTNATDLSSLQINNTLVHADFYAEDNSIYANLSRMKLKDAIGFELDSQMARISDFIDENDYMIIDQLENMNAEELSETLSHSFNQAIPAVNLQSRGYKQTAEILSDRTQSFRFQHRQLASVSRSPQGAAGPHNENKDFEGWTKTYGSWVSQDSTSEYAGYDANLWGQIIGIDQAFDSMLWGIAGGFNRSNLSADNFDSADTDSWFGSIYNSLGTGDWYWDTSLSYASSKVKTQTSNAITQSASFNTHLVGIYTESGKEFSMGKGFVITPNLGAMITYYHQPAYTETSTGAPARQMEIYNKTSFSTSFGASISKDFEQDAFSWKPVFTLNWDHNYNADADRIHFGFEGSSDRFSFNMQAPEKNVLRTGLGLIVAPIPTMEIASGVESLWADGYTSLTANASLRFRF